MNPEKVAQTLTLQKAEASKPRKEYTGVAGRVLKFLCGGCTPIQAANACGVSESLVSQLCAEEEFQKQIEEKLSKDFERAIQIDHNYNGDAKLLFPKLRQI